MGKRGPKPRPIDPDKLRQLAFMLLPDKAIAAGLDMSHRQYRRRMSFENGLAEIVREARQGAAIVWGDKLRAKAEAGNVPAMVALIERAETLLRQGDGVKTRKRGQ
jgi:hypothetical protein